MLHNPTAKASVLLSHVAGSIHVVSCNSVVKGLVDNCAITESLDLAILVDRSLNLNTVKTYHISLICIKN